MVCAWPLTGRADELRLVEAAVSGTGGHGGVVVVGPAGVGKSRLAREVLASAAAKGCVVRWAVATASARSLPLGAFTEWTGAPTTDPLQLVRGVIGALTDRSNGADVVVGVDDAHLLDDLSAFVLHQLVLRGAAKVIVTVRRGEPVPDAVQALWKDERLDRLELHPLSQSESTALVRAALGGTLDPSDMRRLWKLTRGNVLYLRNIVEQELAGGRLTECGGLWSWSGEPVSSPGLIELIESRMGVLPQPIAEVVDVLAVGEPLDTAVLARITDRDAVEEADARGLIALERSGTGTQLQARVAHPLYGEVRRARAAPSRMRRLRGEVATALAEIGGDDMRVTVRRAALSLDSDLAVDPELYTKAANGAIWLADLVLAERLAAAAMTVGGGVEASYIRAHALSWLSRGEEADAVLAGIPTAGFSASEKSRLVFLRAINLIWALGRPSVAKALIDDTVSIASPNGLPVLAAFHTVYWASGGRPVDAIEPVRRLKLTVLPDVVAAVTLWATIVALGDAGRADDAESTAEKGYALVARSFEAAQMRFVLVDAHVGALLLAGRIAAAQDAADRLQQLAIDLPGSAHILGIAIAGRAVLGAGQIATALPLLDLAVLALHASGETNGFGYRYQIGRTQALALSGDRIAAAQALIELDELRHPGWAYLEPERLLAVAWVSATDGAVSEATAMCRSAAESARANGQLAREVHCLQTATQFGDRTTVARLTHLATMVDGPRAPAAAAFASALAAEDGAALHAASVQLEKMGDLLAAADAAALAAVAYRHHDLRGSAITSTSRANRIARECGGPTTPAMQEALQPVPLTSREREIVSLVSLGLSNRDIAERLTLSVRTVEGHLYRATAKTGARSREELGATLHGD
ncbi:helix-turn-helix transcriptional regulator [Rhodococcus sp. ARC_M6]|uniref:helix-turn-helix transcriptional regulator n=1 Tax=Rhodococcus sp. ARC_M6 TaxID=2928852 RepID=UPI001FB281C3|nr:helix-turn-helix transcriptional regulator [Rhodococcus sp. ARC_M6]MCJ0903439.1 helix-turn-helix transcriptional regulator [Rhodococcus sp. ARC_M6]